MWCDYSSAPQPQWWFSLPPLGHACVITFHRKLFFSWWRHQMETFSALLAFCVGNSPVTGELLSQRHRSKKISKLRVTSLCGGNSPKHFPRYWPCVCEFTGHRWIPAQRPVTRSFDVFFDLKKQLSKQSWGWWFETLSHPLWRHCSESWYITHKTMGYNYLSMS